MSDEPRFYDPETVSGMSEDERKCQIDVLKKEIQRYELVIAGLRKRRMSLMTYDELHGEDRHPNW
jgi:hypothetical protein